MSTAAIIAIAASLKAQAAAHRAGAADLDAKADALIASATRPEYVVRENAGDLYPKRTWRALDEWCRRRGVPRLEIAGAPGYRTADVDAAIAATARVATADDVELDEYERLAKGAA